MNIQIQTMHFNADEKLISHINKRVDKLKTFNENILGVDIFLKLDSIQQQIKDKVAEIRVSIPKHTFFVKHQSKVFEESIDVAFDALVNQIKSKKRKSSDATRPEIAE